LILIPLVLVGDYAREFLRVDSCLDRGGSYDYMVQACDFHNSHLFVPYSKRHKALICIIGIVEALFLILFVIVLLRVRQESP
ncbi:MAG: hypothetical protein WA637_20370, partial [Terriglobales bacterium]